MPSPLPLIVRPAQGETWSGLGEHLEDVALPAAEELSAAHRGALGRGELPAAATMAQFALRWVLDHDGVSTVRVGSLALMIT